MNEKINLLLTEYEAITGRSREWRADLSIDDFLKLKNYSKTMSNTSAKDISQKELPLNESRGQPDQSNSSIIKTDEIKEKREVKRFTTPQSIKNTDDDPVSILKSIID